MAAYEVVRGAVDIVDASLIGEQRRLIFWPPATPHAMADTSTDFGPAISSPLTISESLSLSGW